VTATATSGWKETFLLGKRMLWSGRRQKDFAVLLVFIVGFVALSLLPRRFPVREPATASFFLAFLLASARLVAHVIVAFLASRPLPEGPSPAVYVARWWTATVSAIFSLVVLCLVIGVSAPRPPGLQQIVLAQHIILQALSLSLCAAIVLFLSRHIARALALTLAAVLFLVGSMAGSFLDAMAGGEGGARVWKWVARYLPDLSGLDLGKRYAEGMPPLGLNEMGGWGMYVLCFVFVALVFASVPKRSFHRRSHLVLAVAGCCYLLSPALVRPVAPPATTGGWSSHGQALAVRNHSPLGVVLGSLRTDPVDAVFLRVARFVHGGIHFVPTEDHHRDHAHDAHGHGMTTFVPPPEKDWRGVLGDWHRAVKPWRDPSHHPPHASGIEWASWHRLLTLLDPHYVEGYVVGGWSLKPHAPQKALALVNEGIRNNPRAFQIHLVRAQILLHQARSAAGKQPLHAHPEGTVLGRRAREVFEQAATLAVEQRSGAARTNGDGGWTETMEQDARTAVRMAVLLQRALGEENQAREMAQTFLRYFPDDRPLERLARPAS